jgi:hypothetical protein
MMMTTMQQLPNGARDAFDVLFSFFFLFSHSILKIDYTYHNNTSNDKPDKKKAQKMDDVSWATGEFFFLSCFISFLLTRVFRYYWLNINYNTMTMMTDGYHYYQLEHQDKQGRYVSFLFLFC